ncbi:MAG: hypothetical protein IGQ45_12755 [Cyanobacterium sp. T60_A2020_053]|nr:hypothetical protein [Cyanobacterium sp. T60_A2020_053]
MTKSYGQRPSSLTKSPNLEEGRLTSTKIVNKKINQKSVENKQSSNKKKHPQQIKSISDNRQHYPLWLKIMVITITIFSFGGLGFGYTLRYAHKWQQLSSPQTSGLPSNNISAPN